MKTINQLKQEIKEKKQIAEKPLHSTGSLNKMQDMINDLYEKIDEILNKLEEK